MSEVSAQNRAAEEFISGKLAQVDVARIEKELRELWKEAAHGDVDSGAASVVRACSLNLILITDDENAEQNCSDLLDEIEQQHPCRSILAIFRANKAHSLNAWVSARCHTLGSSKQICSEQITVLCEGGRPQELASVVLPLVLPDLPVFIWWRQKRITWDELKSLHSCSRRFIVDTGRFPFDAELLLDTSELIDKNRHCLIVSDLNWRRLNGWCHAIADAFDGFPLPVDYLAKIKNIKFSFAGDQTLTVSNRVLMLTGWLASRLGWEPTEVDLKKSARFKSANGEVEVLFQPDAKDTLPGHLREVEIGFTGADEKLFINPERSEGARFIIARLEDSEDNEATRVSTVLSETILVSQELQVLTADPIYEASNAMVSRMLSVRKK